jgi:hypothetical protein
MKAMLRKDEIVEWDGACQVWDGGVDGWFPSPGEAVDASDGETFYVYPCELMKVRLQEDWVLDTLADDHHESMADELNGDPAVKALLKAVETFNADIELGSWVPIPGKVIVIDRKKFDAHIAKSSAKNESAA